MPAVPARAVPLPRNRLSRRGRCARDPETRTAVAVAPQPSHGPGTFCQGRVTVCIVMLLTLTQRTWPPGLMVTEVGA